MRTVYAITTVNKSGDSSCGYIVARPGLDDGSVLVLYRRMSGNKDKCIAVNTVGLAFVAP